MGKDRYDKDDEIFVNELNKIKENYNDEHCLQYKDEVCAIVVKYGRGDDEIVAKHIRDLTRENYRLMTTHIDGISNIWHHFQKVEYIK
jgi:hypothetical protein